MISDIPQRTTQLENDTDEIRQTFNMLSDVISVHLNRVVRLVKRNGKANVAAELGDDAAELQTAFNTLKTVAQDIKNVDIENIPRLKFPT